MMPALYPARTFTHVFTPHGFTLRGFTLVESLVWLAVLAVVAGFFAEWRSGVYFDGVVTKTVNGFVQFDEAAVAYHNDNGAWPADITQLAPYIPNLQNVDGVAETAGANGVGAPYSLSVDAGGNLTLATTLATLEQAVAVNHQFLNSGSHNPATFEVTLGVVEPAIGGGGGVGTLLGGTGGGNNFGLIQDEDDCDDAGGVWLSGGEEDDDEEEYIGLCFAN